MKAIWIILNLGIAHTLVAQNQHRDLELSVTNIQQNSGQIVVAFYDAPEKFLTNQVYRGFTFPVSEKGIMVQQITGVAAGIYAISIYHDTNGNGELDLNKLGIPVEPVGFSNNARNWFGPPKFQKASFKIPNDVGQISIKVK